MRVFERRPGDSLQLGDEIEVRVLEVGDGRVRLGVDAPRDVYVGALDRVASDVDESTAARSSNSPDERGG